jgi:ketosteroid isomerase-like protein
MNDVEAISTLKTEYREGYDNGDVERVLAVFAPGFIDMEESQPGFYGPEAYEQLRVRLSELFRVYQTRMVMQIADISVTGDFAVDWGWHKLWLTPRSGGRTRFTKFRYAQHWVRFPNGWKCVLLISGRDPVPQMQPYNEAELLDKLSVPIAA